MNSTINELQVIGMSPMPVNGKKATILKWNTKSNSELEKAFKKKDYGDNLAIRTGLSSRCLVVDVDVKNRGLEVWDHLEAKYGRIETYRVRTPSGGLHIYLNYTGTQGIGNYVECVKQSGKKVGIDTRNDNGYVVAPPSVIDGKSYTAEVPLLEYYKTRGNRSTFESLPNWLRSLIVGDCTLDNDYNIIEKVEQVAVAPAADYDLINSRIDITVISKLLGCLKPERADNRNEWRDLVCATRHAGVQYKIKEKLIKAAAHAFSKRSEKYDKAAVDALWDEVCTAKTPVTLGTIRYMAREDDPEQYALICKDISFDGATDITPTCWNDLASIRTTKPTLTKLMQFYKGCVYEVNSGILQYFARMRDGHIQIITKPFVAKGEDFSIPLSPEGTISLRSAFETLSCSDAWKRNINTFDRVDFLPSFTERIEKDGVLNLFTSFPCKPIEGTSPDMEIVEWHLQHILCAGNAEYWEMMQNWLAHFVQKPGQKIEIMPIFNGEQGSGKSIVFDKLFPLLVSADYYHEIDDMNTLFDKFNADQEKKMICVLNEIGTYGKDHGQSGKMKSVMTRKKMKIEHKGMNRYEVSDTCNFILATNKDNPVKIETSNRRYAPIMVSSAKLGDLDYFTTLDAAINHDTVSRFLHKWLQRDISKWVKSKIPKTDALMAMKLIGYSTPTRFMLDIASRQIDILEDDTLRIHSIVMYEYFAQWCGKTGEAVTQQKIFSADLIKMKVPYGNVSIDGDQKKGFKVSIDDLRSLLKVVIKEPDYDFSEAELPDL